MEDSNITVSQGGTTYAGPDAVNLYRAAVIRSALKLLIKGIKPTRGATMTSTLALVKEYTGKTYKRTEGERAIDDMTIWIETMKSAIPVEHKD
jgi:hypothetical protein